MVDDRGSGVSGRWSVVGGRWSMASYYYVKSVQSTLNHLQSPPEQMQFQRNYDSFLSKSPLHGMILFTMLAQNRPKSKRQCFY